MPVHKHSNCQNRLHLFIPDQQSNRIIVSILPEPEDYTSELLTVSGNDTGRLLQHLHAIQYRYSYIPEASIQQLVSTLDLPAAQVCGVISFYSFLHETSRGDYDILFSDSITDHMLGSRTLMADLCTRLGVEPGIPRKDGRGSVDTTSCTGMCDQGPALLVNGMTVTNLDSRRVQDIASFIENRTPLDEWPCEFFEVRDNIRRTDLLLSHGPCGGVPRIRPPFPVTHGYRGRPTVVNNVETFMAAAQIATQGADWFKAAGTEQSTGTKLLSISGDCTHPGIYEFPFGVSIQQVLEACGATDSQAVQVAGAAGFTIPAEEFSRCIAFEDISTGGSFMVFNHDRDLLDMVLNFTRFFVHESCGFCTPCRVGGSLLKDLIDKVHAGQASQYDMGELSNIGTLMKSTSHCGLGTTAPNPVLDTLNKFPHIYERRLAHSGYEPAFDLDAALQEARDITGRDDADAHISAAS